MDDVLERELLAYIEYVDDGGKRDMEYEQFIKDMLGIKIEDHLNKK